jgi:cytosine/adenosine deaminase-related metal-dependent hydrolase
MRSTPGSADEAIMTDLLLRNARPMGGETADILIRDGRIVQITPGVPAGGAATEDAGGRIAIPGLVEAHTHLDKSLIGWPWRRNDVGPRLIDRIENERRVKREIGLDPHVQSMRQALRQVGFGATHIRSHVDVDTEQGLRAVEGVAATRQALAGVVAIEIVAFPQSGMLARPGTVELLDAALAAGADLLGGLDPCGIDRDPRGHVDTLFGLAERRGKPIDIHLHEPGELGAFSMELIFERTAALGMQGKVAISHAFCLGMADWRRSQQLIDRIAELDIRILTTAPASREAPSVRRLLDAGVKVGAGNDGIRDTWGPYGSGDMLERAMFVGLRNDFRRDDEVETALRVCTHGGAEVMDIAGYGLSAGSHADLVLVEGETLAEAVALHAPRALVVKGGRVVARDGAALVAAP